MSLRLILKRFRSVCLTRVSSMIFWRSASTKMTAATEVISLTVSREHMKTANGSSLRSRSSMILKPASKLMRKNLNLRKVRRRALMDTLLMGPSVPHPQSSSTNRTSIWRSAYLTWNKPKLKELITQPRTWSVAWRSIMRQITQRLPSQVCRNSSRNKMFSSSKKMPA